MWYLLLNISIAIWVYCDARSRKMQNPLVWAVLTSLLMVVTVPLYFAKRPLKAQEVREGGTAWNVLKWFAVSWTALMFVAGLSAMMRAGSYVAEVEPGASQTGAAIGTVLGMGMIFALWFFVIAGALALGLFLKQSSIVERGSDLTLLPPSIASL